METEAPTFPAEETGNLAGNITAEAIESSWQERTPASEETCAGLGRAACAGCAARFTCPYLERRQEQTKQQLSMEEDNALQLSSILENLQPDLTNKASPDKVGDKSTIWSFVNEKTAGPSKSYLDQLLDDNIPAVVAGRDDTVRESRPEKEIINTIQPPVELPDSAGDLPQKVIEDLRPQIQAPVQPAPETEKRIIQPVTKKEQVEPYRPSTFMSPNIEEKGTANNPVVVDKPIEQKIEPVPAVVNTTETKSVKTTSIDPEKFERKEPKISPIERSDVKLPVADKQNQSPTIELAEITNEGSKEVDTGIVLEPDKTVFIVHEFDDTKPASELIPEIDTTIEQMLIDDDSFDVPEVEETNQITERTYLPQAEYQIPGSDLVQTMTAEIEDLSGLVEIEVEGANGTNESIAIEFDNKPFVLHDEEVLDEVGGKVPAVIADTVDYDELNRPAELKDKNIKDIKLGLELGPELKADLQAESQNIDDEMVCDYEIEELDLGLGLDLNLILTQYIQQSQLPLSKPTNIAATQNDYLLNQQKVFINELATIEKPTSFDYLPPSDMPVSATAFYILRQLARLALNRCCL